MILGSVFKRRGRGVAETQRRRGFYINIFAAARRDAYQGSPSTLRAPWDEPVRLKPHLQEPRSKLRGIKPTID